MAEYLPVAHASDTKGKGVGADSAFGASKTFAIVQVRTVVTDLGVARVWFGCGVEYHCVRAPGTLPLQHIGQVTPAPVVPAEWTRRLCGVN